MKTEDAALNLEKLTAEEIKHSTRRISNTIFDSAEINKPLPQLIKEVQLAELFNVSIKTVGTWRKNGMIAFIKIGGSYFYELVDVQTFVKKHKRKATV